MADRSAENASTRHFRSLDGLRGIAVLLVVLPHVQLTGTLPGPSIVQRLTHDLAHGVEIFFVLSGFGLALPILQKIHSEGSAQFDLAVYAFNRAFRILPLYYIAFALTILLNALYLLNWHALPATLAIPHAPLQALAQFVFLDRNSEPVNSNFWSIPIQLRWYLVFPLFLLLYARSRRAFIVVLVAAVIAYNATVFHEIDVGTLPLFLLGIVAADVFVSAHSLQKYGWVIAVAGVLLGHFGDRWASAPDTFGREIVWTMQPTTLGWQIAAFGLVVAATSDRRFRSFLALPPLVWLGVASFSIYLIHEPVVEIVVRLIGRDNGIAAAAIGIAAGGALWFCVERRIGAASVRRSLRAHALPAIGAGIAAIGVPRQVEVSKAATQSFTAPIDVETLGAPGPMPRF